MTDYSYFLPFMPNPVVFPSPGMRRDFGHEPQDKGYFSFRPSPSKTLFFPPAYMSIRPFPGVTRLTSGHPPSRSELKTGSRPFL